MTRRTIGHPRPSFDAPVASISFAARLLAAPVVRDEPELMSYLRRSPADLIYHLLVSLRATGAGLDEVRAELDRRREKRAGA